MLGDEQADARSVPQDALRRRLAERPFIERPAELVPVVGGEPIPSEPDPADEPMRESRSHACHS
jgi:hypothetical protein